MNSNEIITALNNLSIKAVNEAANSNVFWGDMVGEVNGHKVSVAALYATGKVAFRKPRITWMVDDKRCKGADLVARISE